ncbi:30S ribosomal protein S4 [Candidatus Microgenomates bacterium]|nr:MAG: 30S ribosomal protein S4 [Candidatus Microgenomates bacterium]
MARYTGPKIRLARRANTDLGVKTPGSHAHATLLKRLNVPPGVHGAKGSRRKISDFGTQLREKQKARRMYGVLEKQFRKYFAFAMKFKGNTGEVLLQQLEKRLDNILYRASLAPTRGLARQLVGHGHVMVNDQRVNIPSYQVAVGDIISLRPKALDIPAIKKQLEDKNPVVPQWLDRKSGVAKILKIPERQDIEADITEQLIVEYYSR